LSEPGSEAEKLLLSIERQAVIEALLQAIVNSFQMGDQSKLIGVCIYFVVKIAK